MKKLMILSMAVCALLMAGVASAVPIGWDVTYGDVSVDGNILTVNPDRSQTQSQGFHGAGFVMSGSEISFDVDLWTMDSYSKYQGWYDVAFVNINQEGYVFDMTWTDPATLPTYAGGEVTNETRLPGSTFAWGGEKWTDRNMEALVGSFELSLDNFIADDPVYVTLGWKTDFDNLFSSGGEFTVNPAAPVPEPATLILFGTGLAGVVGATRRKKK